MTEARTEAGSSWPSAGARILDYLLGRNALIGIASFMLLIISGYATWHGMRDFIVGVSTSPAAGQGAPLPGGLSVSNDMLVIVMVVALTFLMWLTLRETFGARRRLHERLITGPLYVFLFLWSVGFGYGFWWSLISGEEATRSGLAGLQEDARDAGAVVAARLDAVKAQLDGVVGWSDSQMAREEQSGGSCGVASGAGRGPLYNARRSVRDGVTSLRNGMTSAWLGPVQADVEQLRQTAAALGGATVEERQRAFEARAADIRGRARSIAARSNALGRSTAGEMRALAASVAVAPGQPGFSCYDPTLAQRLRQAAEQAEQPAELRLREAQFAEGAAGVAHAIKELWGNVGAYAAGAVRYIFTGTAGGATASGEPISGRDLIALLATIGIDIGLLALAALNPPAVAPVRHDGLARTQAQLHLPTASVIRHLTDAIDTAIARAPGADLEWVRRHFIHHNGASYFVIPNLYSVDPKNKDEQFRALAMNQLAGVFHDLKLVETPSASELKRFGAEESRHSYSDLTPYRDQGDRAVGGGVGGRWPWSRAEPVPVLAPDDGPARIRNHGLLSKAQRTLAITEWSETAQRDVEVFRLVDLEGLTPLLMVLNRAWENKARPASEETTSAQTEAAAGSTRPALLEHHPRT
jgi:hypothetical protein